MRFINGLYEVYKQLFFLKKKVQVGEFTIREGGFGTVVLVMWLIGCRRKL
jgi:hypothetical protein